VRLFVAVRPSAEAVEHAAAAVARVRRSVPDPGVRWIPAERWHLTLAFYGEVPDARVDRLVRRLGRSVAGTADLSLGLSGSGFFRRRAVWLGVVGDIAPLKALAAAVAREDERPYRPHLTVARLRGDTDGKPAAAALSAYAGPAWTAGSVHLVRSHLGPKPTYDDIATWRLSPPGSRPTTPPPWPLTFS
jgi:RNA 2',3'-cyclic 3'-phosphodiesterase